MKKQALYFCPTTQGRLALCPPSRREPKAGHTLTGDIREHRFYSHSLEEEMEVLVYLPPGFSESDPWRYPTLYLHDGQNVFDETTAAFGVEWRADETAETLILSGLVEPMVMVAVANTPERMAHYTPFRDHVHGGGQGARYRDFLCQELKPWIDRLYPTRFQAASTAVVGSSLGGLSSLYLGWTRPDVFGLVAALSPSLWWGGRTLLTRIGGDQGGKRPLKLWVDMGTEESMEDENENGVPDVLDDVRTLRAVLLYHGYKLETDFFYREVSGGRHEESAWALRFGDVLRALFPARETSPNPVAVSYF